MITATAKISNKNQIVLPKEICIQLGVKAGDKLLFIMHNDEVIVRQRPVSFTKAMRGLHKHIWENTDPDHWLAKGCESWNL